MVRIIGFLVGLGFAGVLLISLVVNLVAYVQSPPEPTAEHEFHREPKELHLASNGPFGKFDRQQVQRGYQVYKEVCSACHSMNLVHYRDLAALGYSEAEVKAEAASREVPGINPETGEETTRKAIPTDHFPAPYANETAGRAANNNALPPDLSLITKARHGGAPYVYSLLTGFQPQPAKLLKEFPAAKTPPNLHYNPYFANLNIAMPPPLTTEGQVTYAPGQPKATVDQMSKDVAAFLTWTAEPKKVKRTQVGWPVLGFLLFATILAWMAKNQVWAAIKPKKPRAA